LELGTKLCVGFIGVEMPPFAVAPFVSDHQIAAPKHVVAVLVNATAMPTRLSVIKDPKKVNYR